MYVPAHFAETRVAVLHELMRTRPLATLVTLSSGAINANHIPLHLSAEPGPYGTLRGHIARSNPLWHDLADGAQALAIFHGPDSYITPSWYPAKHEHGKVVPTWNYAVVHAQGSLRVVDDPAWIRRQLEALTAQQEAAFSEQWSLADAPQDFTERLIGAIVGVELVITQLSGKWKVSPNQSEPNQAGVVEGLKQRGDGCDLAVAALVEAYSESAR